MALVKNILSINIINGWMRGVVLGKGSVEDKGWSAPEKVNGVAEIAVALKEAVKATKAKGYYLSIVLEHPLLTQKIVEAPPLRPKNLHLYLAKKIRELKEFDESAAFSYTKISTSARGGSTISVNIFPQKFLDELANAALEAGVFLIQLTPLSNVMAMQFLNFELEGNELGGLLARMGEKKTLVIGDSSGAIFSERTMKGDMFIKEDAEKLTKEINRSILFCKQQHCCHVSKLQITETFDETFLELLRKNMNIPVDYIAKSGRFFWVKEALKMSFAHETNLVSSSVRNSMYVRKFTTVVMASVVTLWIGAVAISGFAEYLLWHERGNLEVAQPQIADLKARKIKADIRNAKLEKMENATKVILEGDEPPVSAWFLSYLTSVVPKEISLTSSSFVPTSSGWTVSLSGNSLAEQDLSAPALGLFVSELRNGPYHINISDAWYEDWVKSQRDTLLGSGAKGGPNIPEDSPKGKKSSTVRQLDFTFSGEIRK